MPWSISHIWVCRKGMSRKEGSKKGIWGFYEIPSKFCSWLYDELNIPGMGVHLNTTVKSKCKIYSTLESVAGCFFAQVFLSRSVIFSVWTHEQWVDQDTPCIFNYFEFHLVSSRNVWSEMPRTIYQGKTVGTLDYLTKYLIECDRELNEQCTLVDLLVFLSEAAQKYQLTSTNIFSKCPQTICKLALAHEESEAAESFKPSQHSSWECFLVEDLTAM